MPQVLPDDPAVQALFETSPHPIVVFDATGVPRLWNRLAEARFPLLSSRASAALFLEALMAPPAAEKFRRLLARTAASGPGEEAEGTFLSFHGQEPPRYRVHTGRFPSDGGTCVVVFFHDVTLEHVQARQLRSHSLFLQQVIDSMATPFFLVDEDRRVRMVNDAFCRLLGHGRGEILGQECPFHRQGLCEHCPLLEEEGPATLPREALAFEAREGRVLHLLKSAARLQTPEGALAAVESFVDVTELVQARRQAEAAMRQAHTASQAKSDFLANMSHEIRTPLNAVIGMTGLLLDTELTEEQREYARTIRSSGEALLSIINDILDFSKIEAGQLELEEIDFEPRPLFEEVLDVLGPKAYEKGLELALLISSEVPARLRGDPTRLRQVLLNLAANAVKFTDRGEVSVSVAVAERKDSEVLLEVSVRDTGIGIPADKLDRLFQPFSQADTSATRIYGGTGLGLVISKRLVERMGGRIWVESTPGQGSVFCFTARLGVPEDQSTEASVHYEVLEAEGLRALVVDDHATNRHILRKQLENWNMEVVEADNGAVALSLLKAAHQAGRPFNLALLDYQMPDMDGRSLAQAIQAEFGEEAPTMILLTSVADVAKAKDLAADGLAAYLVKPIKPSSLVETILQALGLERARRTGKMRKSVITEQLALARARIRKGRVLVVEDNAVNQRVTVKQLEKLGLSADVAADGLEALDAVQRFRYDLVLMDCQMPVLDGYEAARRIRSLEGPAASVPIVALTAAATVEDRQRCFAAGMDDYLAKPVRPEDLKRVVVRYLGKEGETERVARPPAEAATQEPEGPPADLEALKEMVYGDDEALREIAGLFLEDVQERLEALEHALEADDLDRARREAHTLKGASGNFRAARLRDLSAELEQLARQGRSQEARARLPDLKTEVERVTAWLSGELEAS